MMASDPFAEAVAHHRAGRLGEAMELYKQVLRANPGHAGALHLLGVLVHKIGDPAMAVKLILEAIRLDRTQPFLYADLALAFVDSGRPADAARAFLATLLLDPAHARAGFSLAVLFEDAGRRVEAIPLYRHAARLEPDPSRSLNNLGAALTKEERADEATAPLRAALAIDPAMVEGWYNLAQARRGAQCIEEALALYRRALVTAPDHPMVNADYGTALLLAGRSEEGWAQHEWRWKTAIFDPYQRGFVQPLWDGAALNEKRLLLHGEQGLGDVLQFCRYAPLVTGGEVVLEVHPPLVRLLQNLPGVTRVIARGETLPMFDLHCPLMSLPRLFPEIPPAPYLPAPPVRPGTGKKRVGLVWAGSSHHPDDRRRSLPKERLAPLLAISEVEWFSLQIGSPPPEGAADLTQGIGDFADTAEKLAGLDLLITVDTSIAHLAGAIGRPAWVLLAYTPDWRWQLGRSDTPWYPSLRLFRQKKPGDWAGVIEEVVAELSTAATAAARCR
ncbi:MAG TPA: tetratricopeptide repeat-containing glycosyltransferase family protein [Magnetospirillaceae bacterium]|nr:tetratricopeptide repeat-containing glycosyltransferase family protein [Magnetospirillaceae bacterium]